MKQKMKKNIINNLIQNMFMENIFKENQNASCIQQL